MTTSRRRCKLGSCRRCRRRRRSAQRVPPICHGAATATPRGGAGLDTRTTRAAAYAAVAPRAPSGGATRGGRSRSGAASPSGGGASRTPFPPHPSILPPPTAPRVLLHQRPRRCRQRRHHLHRGSPRYRHTATAAAGGTASDASGGRRSGVGCFRASSATSPPPGRAVPLCSSRWRKRRGVRLPAAACARSKRPAAAREAAAAAGREGGGGEHPRRRRRISGGDGRGGGGDGGDD